MSTFTSKKKRENINAANPPKKIKNIEKL